MDLTEPQAGSDLGGITTRATDLPDGDVRVDGQKIFISNGGAEIHLVLARDDDTFDQSKGTTNGLSLVLVPRHREDGVAKRRAVPRLEKKLGIHGSPTCEVVFEGAIGIRLGKKGQGFRAMLDLMNAARLGVASQALGLSDAALHDARHVREPARAVRQVRRGAAARHDACSPRWWSNTRAVRALLYRTYGLLDLNLAREAALAREGLSEAERAEIQAALERDSARVRLLTPLCKYFATEVCSDVTRDAVQIFGGVGFTADADVGKYQADSLIMTIYEGTSEIQASFALKEMGKGALAVVLREVRAELEAVAGRPGARAAWRSAIRAVIERLDETMKVLFSDLSYALMRAKLMAETVIDVIAGAELLKQATADPSRSDIAESFIRRRMLEAASVARRIEDNADGAIRARRTDPVGRGSSRLADAQSREPGRAIPVALLSPPWLSRRTGSPTPIDPSSSSATGCPSRSRGRRTASSGRPSTGGLVSALEPVLRKRGGTWIGWPGTDCARGRSSPPTVSPTGSPRSILSETEITRYYHGFSNRTLWPLMHSLSARTKFDGGTGRPTSS